MTPTDSDTQTCTARQLGARCSECPGCNPPPTDWNAVQDEDEKQPERWENCQ